MKIPEFSDKLKFRAGISLCILAFLLHFSAILRYAVNVPYWDEWEAFQPNGLLKNPTLAQFFAQHNEHRILTTKLLTYALYEIDGWNLVTHQAINFIIYGLTVFLLIYIVKKSAPQLPAWILLFFSLFLFTTVNWENHFWGFQTQFHFSLTFLFLSVWFLFKENQAWGNLLLGVFFAFLLIYSLSGGLVESVALTFIYTCFKLLRLKHSDNKKLEIIQLFVANALIIGIIGSYFIGYVKPGNHPPYTLPYEKRFWVYFLNLLSGGFGYKVANILPGSLILLFTTIPIIGEFYKKRGDLDNKTWILITLTLCIFASLLSIVIGRAQFGTGHSKASRYAEVIIMLIPLSIAMWSIYLGDRPKFRRNLLLVFWLFCFGSYFSYWNFWKVYRSTANDRALGVECIKNYYINGGDGNCPTIYPMPIPDRLEFNRNSDQSSLKAIRKSIGK
jgi:hypothetical protein